MRKLIVVLFLACFISPSFAAEPEQKEVTLEDHLLAVDLMTCQEAKANLKVTLKALIEIKDTNELLREDAEKRLKDLEKKR